MYALHAVLERVFCMRAANRDRVVKAFIASGKAEEVITYAPTQNARRQCAEMNLPEEPVTLRLVRVELPGEVEVLITNLLDTKRHPACQFKKLYHLRWGVEEFYKRLQYHQEIENSSGKSALVVQQDFHAGILAGNLAAALALAGQRKLDRAAVKKKPSIKRRYQINFAQAFAKMKQYQAKLWTLAGSELRRYLEELVKMLMQYTELVRSERSFPRKTTKFNKRCYWMNYKCTL